MYNKYWKISWWLLYDIYDQQAHKLAIKEIGECLTASWEIKYFRELDNLVAWYEILDVINTTEHTCVIEVMQEGIAKATFTFVKRK